MNHGTSTAYMSKGCRCETCKVAHSKRQKRYRLDRARGVQRLVDAQPLRDHVDALYAAGMSQWDITIAAGWKSRNALADAYRRAKVTPRTMQRVLSVTAPPVQRRNGYVDATAARRRLQALAVLGWSTRAIAGRLGNLDAQTYQFIQSGRNRTIRRRTDDAIAQLYDELWQTMGPSARTRTLAVRKGWVPPLAWDDDDIANPEATPHGSASHVVPRTTRTRQVLIEDYLDTLGYHGGDVLVAAERLGMSVDALERALFRARKDGIEVPMKRGEAVA